MSRFFTCAALIFLLAVPVFYLLTKYFYAEDLMDVIEAVERGERLPDLDLERDIVAGMVMQLSLTFAVLCAALYITVRYASRRLWKTLRRQPCKGRALQSHRRRHDRAWRRRR